MHCCCYCQTSTQYSCVVKFGINSQIRVQPLYGSHVEGGTPTEMGSLFNPKMKEVHRSEYPRSNGFRGSKGNMYGVQSQKYHSSLHALQHKYCRANKVHCCKVTSDHCYNSSTLERVPTPKGTAVEFFFLSTSIVRAPTQRAQ